MTYDKDSFSNQNITGGNPMTRFFRKYSDKLSKQKESMLVSPTVCEVYMDGTLKKAEVINDNMKSYGIFMHSLILSTSENISNVNSGMDDIMEESERAITLFTLNKGFDKKLFETIAPKVPEVEEGIETEFKPSVHLINEKLRVIAKGNPSELLKRCNYVLIDSKYVKLTRRLIKEINTAFKTMLDSGLRVYALAIKDLSEISENLKKDILGSGMIFVALVGIGMA